MDPFKKSFFIYGLFIPLLFALILCLALHMVQSDIQRQYHHKKRTYDEMKKQEQILQQTTDQQAILKQELSTIRSYFLPTHTAQATAAIASQCSEDKGLKLGDLKQTSGNDSSKTSLHQLKLLGRSSPLIEVLGETQRMHPALLFNQWSISLQIDQKYLLFQGTLQLVNVP